LEITWGREALLQKRRVAGDSIKEGKESWGPMDEEGGGTPDKWLRVGNSREKGGEIRRSPAMCQAKIKEKFNRRRC